MTAVPVRELTLSTQSCQLQHGLRSLKADLHHRPETVVAQNQRRRSKERALLLSIRMRDLSFEAHPANPMTCFKIRVCFAVLWLVGATGWLAPAATLAGFFIVNFVAESYKRFKSGSVLAAGIAGELRGYEMAWPLLVNMMNAIVAAHEPDGAPKLEIKFRGEFEPPKDRVFEANVANLGLLGPELAAKVSNMYGRFVGFRAAFKILYNHYDDMTVIESREQARFIRKWLEDIKTNFDTLVPLLDQRSKADWLLTKLATYSAP